MQQRERYFHACAALIALLATECGEKSTPSAGAGGSAGSIDSGRGGALVTAGTTTENGGSSESGASSETGGSPDSGGSSGAGAGEQGGSVGAAGTPDRGAAGFVAGPSCAGLTENCGPNGDQNCCASTIVPGGTFHRANGTSLNRSAFVSAYRLDVYEVTIGRFMKFLDGYDAHLPMPGSGNNPGNPNDPGWHAEWDASLVGHDELVTSIADCQQTVPAYASHDDDLLPMSCISWFEAYAFCIWDGGRLPTNAEWNFASAGGAEQREYPWSDPPESLDIDASYAVYYDSENPDVVSRPERVGSKSPKGDARWGQADMSGSVWEWNQDWYQEFPDFCINCATLTGVQIRTMCGGSFYGDAESLLSSSRLYHAPLNRDFVLGVRCARKL